MVLATALAFASSADDVNGPGSEVAIWIPPTLWHPMLVFVLVVVVPEVIGLSYFGKYWDQEIVREWWRIVILDTGEGRSPLVEYLVSLAVISVITLTLLVAAGFTPPQTPDEALEWRNLVDRLIGTLVALWLLAHTAAWAGAVDLVEERRARMRRRQANLRRLAWEREKQAMQKKVQEGVREMSRVARGVRRERRERLREESMASAVGADCGARAVGRECGRGGGRIGGRSGLRLGLQSDTVKMDPIQAAWDLDNECYRRLGQGVQPGGTAFELSELKEWEHRVEQAMLKLDELDLSGDGSSLLRTQRKSVLMVLDATGKFIETLIRAAKYQKMYPKLNEMEELKGLIE